MCDHSVMTVAIKLLLRLSYLILSYIFLWNMCLPLVAEAIWQLASLPIHKYGPESIIAAMTHKLLMFCDTFSNNTTAWRIGQRRASEQTIQLSRCITFSQNVPVCDKTVDGSVTIPYLLWSAPDSAVMGWFIDVFDIGRRLDDDTVW